MPFDWREKIPKYLARVTNSMRNVEKSNLQNCGVSRGGKTRCEKRATFRTNAGTRFVSPTIIRQRYDDIPPPRATHIINPENQNDESPESWMKMVKRWPALPPAAATVGKAAYLPNKLAFEIIKTADNRGTRRKREEYQRTRNTRTSSSPATVWRAHQTTKWRMRACAVLTTPFSKPV